MRIEGKVWKDNDELWLAEIPLLDILTQGEDRKDAIDMAKDAIESLINKEDFRLETYLLSDDTFEVETKNYAAIMALILKRQREASGLSLAMVSEKLGQNSRNAYARYERGDSVPTVEQFSKFIETVTEKRLSIKLI